MMNLYTLDSQHFTQRTKNWQKTEDVTAIPAAGLSDIVLMPDICCLMPVKQKTNKTFPSPDEMY